MILRRSSRALLGIVVVLALGAGLSACASLPDPDEMRESLTDVTETPTVPDAAEKLDVDALPEPIVDPLECKPYLVITARGTNEPSDKQLLHRVAKNIAKARPDEVLTYDLDYPADTDVAEGGTLGVRLLIDTLNVQADACPDQRFVLLGYSQGALVVGDALIDETIRLVGGTVGALSDEAEERIVAVVFYGNPRFFGQEPYNAGDYDPSLNGILPRPLGSLDAYADRMVDFCVSHDFVCQSSMDLDERGHVAYFKNDMRQEGVDFVLDRLDAADDRPGSDDGDADSDDDGGDGADGTDSGTDGDDGAG